MVETVVEIGMNLQTFKATTMAEALQQVKSQMGHDAVILHTRTYQLRQWLGLRRREMVEVTAGRGLNFPRRTRQNPSTTAAIPPRSNQAIGANASGLIYGPGSGRATGVAITSTATASAAIASTAIAPRNAVEGARQLLDTPAAGNAMMIGVGQELAAVKKMVERLILENSKLNLPKLPEELLEHYTKLVQNEVTDELAQDILRTLHREIRPEYLSQVKYVREKLTDHIERLIPSSGPITRRQRHGPHVLALIGPTGVGKTTTLAKIAANLKLKEGHRVGLITLDTYRIAAVDQLKRYADIIGSPLKVVGNPEELRDAMATMSGMDFVLIDTAGRSPNDVMKLNELRELLGTIQPDEVHLVLSSTSAPTCLELAVQRFSDVRVDRVIFTKLDEAVHVGVVLNVMRKINKSLSYVTTGQNVPNDIELGRGRMVAKMILGEDSADGSSSGASNSTLGRGL
jgi:flagellar biosynthesis protein FlhF